MRPDETDSDSDSVPYDMDEDTAGEEVNKSEEKTRVQELVARYESRCRSITMICKKDIVTLKTNLDTSSDISYVIFLMFIF